MLHAGLPLTATEQCNKYILGNAVICGICPVGSGGAFNKQIMLSYANLSILLSNLSSKCEELPWVSLPKSTPLLTLLSA